jgi:hypothetical protein
MKMIEGLNPRMDYQFEAAVNQAKNYQTIW